MRSFSFIVLTVILALNFAEAGGAGRDVLLVDLSVEATIPANQALPNDGRSNVILTIRNGDAGLRPAPPAIALRAVFWAEDGNDLELWHGPIAGVDAVNDDGTIDFISASAIAHTADTIPMTTRSFDRGVLLVNETLQVSRPTNITRAITRELVIRYAVIPRALANDLFVPVDRQGEWQTIFGPINADALELRQGRGGVGLVPGTEQSGPASLEIFEERFDLRLIYADDPAADDSK